MKKLSVFISLFLAISTLSAQFVPTEDVFYNILQNNPDASKTLGQDASKYPTMQVVDNSVTQAFEFIPTGAPNTYNIVNALGEYFTAYSYINAEQAWDATFTTEDGGEYSKWVIEGTTVATVRLKNVFEDKYLGADAAGGQMYVDKAVDNAFGEFTLTVATVEGKVEMLNGGLVIEIEDGLSKTVPVYFTARGFSTDITVTLSGGFTTSQTTYAPAEQAGTIQLDIEQGTAAVGDTGKVYVSYDNNQILDSATITVVSPYTYYYIKNSNDTKVIVMGQSSTDASNPAFVAPVDNDATQQFAFRSVNPDTPEDSLVYIVQKDDYDMLKKGGSAWGVDFGMPSDASEAVWKITEKGGAGSGIFSIANSVNMAAAENPEKACLGADSLKVDADLYTDKVYPDNNTGWMFTTSVPAGIESVFAPSASTPFKVFVANGNLSVKGVDSFEVYNLQGISVAKVSVNSGVYLPLKPGIYFVKSGISVQKVMVE